jgi:cation:H+ antiporter
MIATVFPYFIILIGFAFLIKGADLLVDGASAVARRFNVSDMVIGLTVVAFGTSAPELAVNLIAAAQKTTDIAISNVIGSNIANILLILGTAVLIRPPKSMKLWFIPAGYIAYLPWMRSEWNIQRLLHQFM